MPKGPSSSNASTPPMLQTTVASSVAMETPPARPAKGLQKLRPPPRAGSFFIADLSSGAPTCKSQPFWSAAPFGVGRPALLLGVLPTACIRVGLKERPPMGVGDGPRRPAPATAVGAEGMLSKCTVAVESPVMGLFCCATAAGGPSATAAASSGSSEPVVPAATGATTAGWNKDWSMTNLDQSEVFRCCSWFCWMMPLQRPG
mmetsp:Transcript_109412/g.306018  ORF Transcript_109412/g.306018 Transcript_109412/m.306018 type:complete len:202 (+) Transcript_109412:350-955(+)